MTALQNQYWTRVESERHNKRMERHADAELTANTWLKGIEVGTKALSTITSVIGSIVGALAA